MEKKVLYINKLEKRTWNHLKVNEAIVKTLFLEKGFQKDSAIDRVDTLQNLEQEKKLEEIFFTSDLNTEILEQNKKIKQEQRHLKKSEQPNEINIKTDILNVGKDDITLDNENRNMFIAFGKAEEQEEKVRETKPDNIIEKYRDYTINIKAENNSKLNIYIIYNNENSFSLDTINVEAKTNSKIYLTYVFLGNKKQYLKHISNVYKGSEIHVSCMYILNANNMLDFMYKSNNLEENAKTSLDIEGVLFDQSSKTTKLLIDFKKGAKGAEANENENLLMLSDQARSKTLPVLLTNEEDVVGTHGATIGKVDEKHLFYIMSRGYSREEAIKLILKSKLFNILIKNNYDKRNKEVEIKSDSDIDENILRIYKNLEAKIENIDIDY